MDSSITIRSLQSLRDLDDYNAIGEMRPRLVRAIERALMASIAFDLYAERTGRSALSRWMLTPTWPFAE